MSSRADRTAATRAGILEAVESLLREGHFHDASMEAIATRAGVTRVTLYRAFGSKQALLEALAWSALGKARLDRVDAAHALPDVREAVRQVLRANCQMFADLADAIPLALEIARIDASMRSVVDATYHGRRHQAMERLAARVVREGYAAPGWTKTRIADALVVLTGHEAFHTLVEHRGHSVNGAADALFHVATGFLAQ